MATDNIKVKVKDITIGAGSPIVVQTMCNTHTQDIEPSVEQCIEMVKAGAQMIRLTTQGIKEVESLKVIKQKLEEAGYNVPLVADVHFSSEVAIAAAAVADKVRINPGNFAKEHSEAQRQFARFIEVCKEHNTAVRIGLNHGSLGERIINLYGDTPLGMKEAVMEWLDMCVEQNFYNVVVSLKASNTIVMATAYRLLKQAMNEKGLNFPLHLGVTEAGNGDMGRIKSAVGIGALLADKIGDTIRVSLTENPVNEIPAAQTIATYFSSCPDSSNSNNSGSNCSGSSGSGSSGSGSNCSGSSNSNNSSITGDCNDSTCSNSSNYWADIACLGQQLNAGQTPAMHFEAEDWNEFIIKASCLFGPLLLDKKIDEFKVSATIKSATQTARQPQQATRQSQQTTSQPQQATKQYEQQSLSCFDNSSAEIAEFKDNLMQAARRKFTKPEYIACPGCGRTLYNLEETFNEVKRRTSHLKGMRIAVMGCIVNGPGEMADADYGYVGEGKGKVAIYRGKEAVMRSVPQEEAIDALLKIIEEDTLR